MASSKSKKETWIRSFNVTEPTKHEKGFTVYKVTYRAFRLDKAEEVNECIVWKRYNDFKKLHQALSVLHYQLRRPEKFPEFAKAKFFGRFEEKVIEERRQSAYRLLEFTVKVPPLAKSQYFQEFFKGGETVTRRKVTEDESVLQPQVIHPSVVNEAFRSQSSSNASVAASIPRVGGEGQEKMEGTSSKSVPAPLTLPGLHTDTVSDGLGGVWLHRKQEEEDPGGDREAGENDDSDDERTTFSEDSIPSTPLPQLEDLTPFDPLSSTEPGSAQPSSLPHSNSWLFRAMDMCADLPELDNTPTTSVTNDSTDSGITVSIPPSLQSYTTDASSTFSTPGSTNQGTLSANRSNHSSLARAYLNSLRAQQAADEDARLSGIPDSHNSLTTSTASTDAIPTKTSVTDNSIMATGGSSPRNRHASEDSISGWEVTGEEDYLYQAAGKISLALDNESVGNYQASFDAYKAGVAILLQGVVGDKSKARREAVRRKTAQYLMKAEDIYNNYLSAEANNDRRWESEKMTAEVDPSSAHLRGSADELKNYKVLGCINSVMLVLDMSTYQSFIIKSLSKCSVPNTSVTTRVPAYCPYMVRLYRYFETETSIYLLLEHATGGKLWDYASPYLKQQQQQNLSIKHELASSLKSSILSRQRSHSGDSHRSQSRLRMRSHSGGGQSCKETDIEMAIDATTGDISNLDNKEDEIDIGIDSTTRVSSSLGIKGGSFEHFGSVTRKVNSSGFAISSGTGQDHDTNDSVELVEPIKHDYSDADTPDQVVPESYGTLEGVMDDQEDLHDLNEGYNERIPKETERGADVSSISSMEGKLSQVSSSYVNLLDACGEEVTGNLNFEQEHSNMAEQSDSNLNDLVNASLSYGDFDVISGEYRVDNNVDDNIFSTENNISFENSQVERRDQKEPDPIDSELLAPLSVNTSEVQQPHISMFSIDSIESPDDYKIEEMDNSSVFGFEKGPKDDEMEGNMLGNLGVEPSLGAVGVNWSTKTEEACLDPSTVIADALAVVKEVEQMRKDEELEDERLEEVRGVTFQNQHEPVHENMTNVDSSLSSTDTKDMLLAESKPKHPFGITEFEEAGPMSATMSSSSGAHVASVGDSQAFLDTRGFGVFSEVETSAGVDLAEFFDSGSHPSELKSSNKTSSSTAGFSEQSDSRLRLKHSASLLESQSYSFRDQSFSSKENKRSFSVSEKPSIYSDWTSFFERQKLESKGGFGFDSANNQESDELKSTDFSHRDNALQENNQDNFTDEILNLPRVPDEVPYRSENEEDFDVFDIAQYRQRPDGATSEELDQERKTKELGEDLGKQAECANISSEKDVNLHINPLESDDHLFISETTDSRGASTFVSTGIDSAVKHSTGVMKDYPSSSTVSPQLTPQHTFKQISSSPQKSESASVNLAKERESVKNSEVDTINSSDLNNDLKTADSFYTDNVSSEGPTPTSSRVSTLKGGKTDQKESNLPSLSRLFSHLDDITRVRSESNAAVLPESCVRIWASEILMALSTLHAAGIVCRDLNPDNILLADGGHIRLTYFSQWQWVERDMSPKALSLGFVAPEVTGIYEVGSACDWWSFGAILFELLSGKSLCSCHPSGINSHTQLSIPGHSSPEAKDLLRQLLQVNPSERLGGGQSGAEEVKSHPFFRGVTWSNLLG